MSRSRARPAPEADPPVDPARSALMARVAQKGSRPERLLRRALHALGYRFRMNRRDLPGSPDIVLPRHRTVVFVHGCFWHQHPGCRRATLPKTRADFWRAKFAANAERDTRVAAALRAAGWQVCTAWECEVESGQAPSAVTAALAAAQPVKRGRRGPRRA